MLYPDELGVGLKEWDSVCQALLQGRQIALLRKGGIHESGGEFELEFRRFFLFPTFLHQDKEMLKPEHQDLFQYNGSEPKQIQLSAYADVTDIVRIQSPEQIAAIDACHIWTPRLIQSRLDYRPENPLYLLVVRTGRLAEPITIENHSSYAGCRSWVGLRKTINVKDASPVLDPPTHQSRRDEIMMKISSAKPREE